uniref:Uncharacterized protein n=1 Tax=Lepeophtheirus salmonis TaxID=72036 RepID=A0A0K2T179_LEPSM
MIHCCTVQLLEVPRLTTLMKCGRLRYASSIGLPSLYTWPCLDCLRFYQLR